MFFDFCFESGNGGVFELKFSGELQVGMGRNALKMFDCILLEMTVCFFPVGNDSLLFSCWK